MNQVIILLLSVFLDSLNEGGFVGTAVILQCDVGELEFDATRY